MTTGAGDEWVLYVLIGAVALAIGAGAAALLQWLREHRRQDKGPRRGHPPSGDEVDGSSKP